MSSSHIGVIGLAVMGANLARNFASRGFTTSVFNRTYEKTELLLDQHGHNLVGFETLHDFVQSLVTPRKIVMMVKSGQPVDELIDELRPFLNKNDIVIDCGNSNWHDTESRQKALKGVCNYIGCGVSGGSNGALYGPSIMPGGEAETVTTMLKFFEPAAAKDFAGKPTVSLMGKGPAGHFVKMVHNGIEYGLMQGISEIYGILRGMGMNHEQMRVVFGKLNHGNLQSYLLDITEDILETKLSSGDYLLNLVDHIAGSKGTGGWTVESGIELGVNVQTLAAALFARFASSGERYPFGNIKQDAFDDEEMTDELVEILHNTLEIVYLSCYMQGLRLIEKASKEYIWVVSVDEVLRVWEGGCIIRSQMISTLRKIMTFNQEEIAEYYELHLEKLFHVMRKLTHYPQAKPVIHSSFDYILTITSTELPTNLIQAQRDYFGEHGYRRTDKDGDFTGGWVKN
jgi:6-phosphogluconate dehydrogenase